MFEGQQEFKNGQDVTKYVSIVDGAPVGASLPIEFYVKRKKNEAKTRQSGELVFEDIEYCRIYVPGHPIDIREKPVDENVLKQFGAQYAQWQRNKEQTMPGIPVREWAMVTGDEVTVLESFGFKTIESLAASDQATVMPMGQWGLGIRLQAQAFLESIRDGAAAAKRAAELATIKEERDAMREELDELRAALNELKQQRVNKKGG